MFARSALFAAALLLAGASAAVAQEARDPDAPPRFYLGGNLGLASPSGEFADHVGNGLGLDGHLLFRPDPRGLFSLRLDAGYVNYGRESRPVPISPTVGGRITVDLTTNNDIFFVGIGPQLGAPGSRIQPYVNGSVGVAYFVTGSSLSGDRDNESFANTTNYDDGTIAYGAGAGVYVPLRRGRTPIVLDLSVRYHRNGRVSYLTEGGIRDNPDGSITLSPITSDANLLTFQVGITGGLRDRECDRDWRRRCRGD